MNRIRFKYQVFHFQQLDNRPQLNFLIIGTQQYNLSNQSHSMAQLFIYAPSDCFLEREKKDGFLAWLIKCLKKVLGSLK